MRRLLLSSPRRAESSAVRLRHDSAREVPAARRGNRGASRGEPAPEGDPQGRDSRSYPVRSTHRPGTCLARASGQEDIMRPLPVLFSAFLISLASLAPIATPAGAAPDGIAPAAARVATIEATAPLDEESEGAVKAAITSAIQTAARGALAMGLPWVHIQSAYVRP